MNDIISSIELFPNELLIEIFEYLSPYDLYKTFYNLNSHFNSIINSLENLRLILQEDWDNKQQVTPFFATQISTLVIKHDELIHFSSYSNIHSLKLSMPTADQCNAIQPSLFPNLEYLYISNLFFSDHSEQLCRLIFSPSFFRLRICQLDRMTLDDGHSYYSSTLRQLIISPSTWKSNMFKQIFNACPNLIHLRILRLRNLSFKLSSNDIPLHTSLRHLHIHYNSIGNQWYNQIDWLLSIVPNLENFTCRIDQNELNIEFPFDLFACLLKQHVPNLINFKAKIPLKRFLSKELNAIKRLHSLFINIQFHGYTNRDVNSYLVISSKN
jgi:hypothetical protein